MSPIRDFPSHVAKALLGVFFDIDDTFTTHGKIGPKPFQAIWSLKEAGLKAVPITGRPVMGTTFNPAFLRAQMAWKGRGPIFP